MIFLEPISIGDSFVVLIQISEPIFIESRKYVNFDSDSTKS